MSAARGTLTGAGGLELSWRAWLPDGPARAVVIVVHGGGEHSGRYAWAGERLAEGGYAVHAHDHRGHGASQGERMRFDDLTLLAADARAFTRLAAAEHPGAPVFVLGHSMGGAVALELVLDDPTPYAGLVLSAPVAVVDGNRTTRLAASLLSRVAPGVGVYRVDSERVSRDPEVVRAYDADPLVFHGSIPARTIAAITAAVDTFPDRLEELELPLLTMHGTADTIASTRGSRLVFERAGSADKEIELYNGLSHELLNEPEREGVLARIRAWLDERSG